MNCKELMTSRSERYPYNLTSAGLSKMLMFGDYVKSRAVKLSKTQKEQCCQMAEIDPFLSLDCAKVEGWGRNPRKGRDQFCSAA